MANLDEFWSSMFQDSGHANAPFVRDVPKKSEMLRDAEICSALKTVLTHPLSALNANGCLSDQRLRFDQNLLKLNKPEDIIDGVLRSSGMGFFTCTLDYFHEREPLWRGKASDLSEAYRRTRGFPMQGMSFVLIAGAYKRTWIGLHADLCETYLIPLVGRKKMHFWHPNEFVDQIELDTGAMNGLCLGDFDYKPRLARATTIEVEQGQVLFIPPGWWHINELEYIEPTVTLSTGVFSRFNAETACDLEARERAFHLLKMPKVRTFSSFEDVPVSSEDRNAFVGLDEVQTKAMKLKYLSGRALAQSEEPTSCNNFDDREFRYTKRSDSFLVHVNEEASMLFSHRDVHSFSSSSPQAKAIDMLHSYDRLSRVDRKNLAALEMHQVSNWFDITCHEDA